MLGPICGDVSSEREIFGNDGRTYLWCVLGKVRGLISYFNPEGMDL